MAVDPSAWSSALPDSSDALDFAVLNPQQTFDEVALAQLGAAAVLLWAEMAPTFRERLLHTADAVVGVSTVPDARRRLTALIASHSRLKLTGAEGTSTEPEG